MVLYSAILLCCVEKGEFYDIKIKSIYWNYFNDCFSYRSFHSNRRLSWLACV